MISYISYDICATVILLVLFFLHILKKKTDQLQDNMYLGLLTVMFMTAITDLLSSDVLQDPDTYTHAYRYAIFSTTQLTHIISSFFYVLYGMSLAQNRFKDSLNTTKYVLAGPLIASIILILTNPLTQMIFKMEHGMAVAKVGQVWIDLIVVYYMIFAPIYLCYYKDAVSFRIRTGMYVFSAIYCISSIIHWKNPAFSFENFGGAICMLVVFSQIQKPDEIIDPVIGVFNEKSFSDFFASNSKQLKFNSLFLVNMEDIRFFQQTLGKDGLNDILRNVAIFMEENISRKVFLIDQGTFAILHNVKTEDDLMYMNQRFRDRFKEIWNYDGNKMHISAKIMYIRLPEDALILEDVYEYSSYLQEVECNSQCFLYAKDIDFKDRKKNLILEKCIKRAIEQDLFQVYYQPIYSVRDKCINSAEALLRLFDPEYGYIPPGDFIPIAEKNGMIHAIGDMVFEKVCRFMSENDLKKKGIGYIEINLSTVQCMQENLPNRLLHFMDRYNIDKDSINLEITETAAINSPKMLKRNVEFLVEKQITFSLDDFGTGYSNANSLVNLPLHIVKFDKSMIDAAIEDDKGKIILTCYTNMIKKLNLKIVAEGVETKEQLDLLENIDIDYIQGYYFSKPVCSDEFLSFIKNFSI